MSQSKPKVALTPKVVRTSNVTHTPTVIHTPKVSKVALSPKVTFKQISSETIQVSSPPPSGRTAFHIKSLEEENRALRAENEELRYANERLRAAADLDVRIMRLEQQRALIRAQEQIDAASTTLHRFLVSQELNSDSESEIDEAEVRRVVKEIPMMREHGMDYNRDYKDSWHMTALYLHNYAKDDVDGDLDDSTDDEYELGSDDEIGSEVYDDGNSFKIDLDIDLDVTEDEESGTEGDKKAKKARGDEPTKEVKKEPLQEVALNQAKNSKKRRKGGKRKDKRKTAKVGALLE